MVVVLCESVCLVAYVLQEFFSGVVCGELEGVFVAVYVDKLLFFCDRCEQGHWSVHFYKGLFCGVELAEASVDEYDIGPKLFALKGMGVSSCDDFFNAGVIVDAGDGLDLESSVSAFERFSVNELHERAYGLLAGDVCDIDAFYYAYRFFGVEYLLQFFQCLGGVSCEDLGLDIGFYGSSFAEALYQAYSIAVHGG